MYDFLSCVKVLNNSSIAVDKRRGDLMFALLSSRPVVRTALPNNASSEHAVSHCQSADPVSAHDGAESDAVGSGGSGGDVGGNSWGDGAAGPGGDGFASDGVAEIGRAHV